MLFRAVVLTCRFAAVPTAVPSPLSMLIIPPVVILVAVWWRRLGGLTIRFRARRDTISPTKQVPPGYFCFIISILVLTTAGYSVPQPVLTPRLVAACCGCRRCAYSGRGWCLSSQAGFCAACRGIMAVSSSLVVPGGCAPLLCRLAGVGVVWCLTMQARRSGSPGGNSRGADY